MASGPGITTNVDTTTTVRLTGTNQIDSLLELSKWGGSVGTGATITYSFPTSGANYASSAYGSNTFNEPSQFVALSATAQQLVRTALAAWSAVANVTFVEVADSSTSAGDLRFGATGTLANQVNDSTGKAGDIYAETYAPNSGGGISGDIWINSTSLSDFNISSDARGQYAFMSLEHEIGHALGLKHPFETAHGNSTILAPSTTDFMAFSIMSYNSSSVAGAANSLDNTANVFPSTPMAYDIAAIQYLYGASTQQISSYSFGGTDKLPAYQVIEDSQTPVSLDASQTTKANTISLVPNSWSAINGLVAPDKGAAFAGVYLESDTTVGTLICGNLGDTVTGFGQCTIVGGSGSDSITAGNGIESISGGAGNDTLIAGTGSDTLLGGAGNDRIQISASGSGSIDGGAGTNTLVVSATRASFSITVTGTIISLHATSGGGTDTLSNIQSIQFSDQTVATQTLVPTAITAGRAPEPAFDASYYLSTNRDVAAAGIDAQTHFDNFGWKEGRNPDVLFDVNYYLQHNPDVAKIGMDPLLHYEMYGWKEGRDPGPNFSTLSYLAHNADVKAAGINPLDHYLLFGISEGRSL